MSEDAKDRSMEEELVKRHRGSGRDELTSQPLRFPVCPEEHAQHGSNADREDDSEHSILWEEG